MCPPQFVALARVQTSVTQMKRMVTAGDSVLIADQSVKTCDQNKVMTGFRRQLQQIHYAIVGQMKHFRRSEWRHFGAFDP